MVWRSKIKEGNADPIYTTPQNPIQCAQGIWKLGIFSYPFVPFSRDKKGSVDDEQGTLKCPATAPQGAKTNNTPDVIKANPLAEQSEVYVHIVHSIFEKQGCKI